MERLSELETRISSFAQLQDVISVMRSLAASRIQQAQNALAAIRAYSDTIGAVDRQGRKLPDAGMGRALSRWFLGARADFVLRRARVLRRLQ